MTLDAFVNARYANAPGSPIRELKRYAELPGMISLAGGYPAPELMDAAGLQKALAGLSMSAFASALEYGGTEGSLALRTELAQLSTRRGMPTEPADVLALSGSQQGLDLLARTLITEGDVVLVESPTYPAALSAFRFAGATVRQVAADEEGLDMAALERALVQHKPKFLYTVPTFGNPSGKTLGPARRRRLLELAVQHDCLVVEDDPYGDLWFDAPPPPPIHSLLDQVPGAARIAIYLSSLSKTLAPGLRLGWMLGPAAIRRACVLAKQTDDMHASTLTQAAAAAYLGAGQFQANLPRLRQAYGRRAAALVNGIRQRLGDRVALVVPAGGMFVWARCEGLDTTAWLQPAIRKGVLFVPGAAFFAEQPVEGTFRLSFASQDEAGLAVGAARLADSLRALP
jgi:DNA-binding transcriptional MocR family regulator